ncbi:MAG TPA: putative lipid II flippase FtsW [Thermoclostridium caenicola]|uniref:Probable peptidoglycan glycosyltransferase FtsW n=1 Tax=Thermoclostridium caenicola TaxID=659425 RepID=A0A1M6FAW0_9FIRM|nr:putative lipid II flippase FtsW [Thermoclostridium caenicola]SHI94781.1 cell division protein FtsW [Thermoclostridium caenicola]HOK43724.1 putative lipid II flippase FtsW [Thermoclostridium caenicola]HOL85499.1 putative lipid II flippase FtsW [Thermoclostridium caenicola]HPO76570.1 putative lipid II flippase FtsW [Thermoclostridium caenicola]HPU21405.1 putative lipid II flippase FtsW [Thermoclostridium caenicola]
MRKREYDFWLLFAVIALTAIGIVMVFSASSYYAAFTVNNKYHYLIRQLLWSGVGLVLMFVVSNIDYRRLALLSPILMLVSIVLLILVAIPGIGSVSNNARRWFNLGFTTFQPSELMKLSLIMFLSFSLAKNHGRLRFFFSGLVPYLLIVGFVDFLLLLEPHYSCAILITAVAAVILFCAGARLLHFFAIGGPALAAAAYLIYSSEYRWKRFVSFLDPFSDPQGAGYQVVNSLYAIASGSIFGRGLGKSLQKYLYIPEPQNDFIFSIVAEELGFVGAFTVIAFFLLLIWRGIRISMNAPDMMGSLMAIGLTSLIAIESIVNIAVVTATIPVTGMPLPFISYGGTSMLFHLVGMGILLNISRNNTYSLAPVKGAELLKRARQGEG